MVHTNSRRLMFGGFLLVNVLAGSMLYGIDRFIVEGKSLRTVLAASALASTIEYGVNRFIQHNPPGTFPLVGYDVNIAPVKSELRSIKMENQDEGRSTPEVEAMNVVSATEARYGLRVGYFTVGIKIPQDGTFVDKFAHLHPHIDGFTLLNVAKTIAASYALQAGLQLCATKFGSCRK